MVIGPYTKHFFSLAFRAMFILARHTALMWYQGSALGADAFTATAHGVFMLLSGHDANFPALICLTSVYLRLISWSTSEVN